MVQRAYRFPAAATRLLARTMQARNDAEQMRANEELEEQEVRMRERFNETLRFAELEAELDRLALADVPERADTLRETSSKKVGPTPSPDTGAIVVPRPTAPIIIPDVLKATYELGRDTPLIEGLNTPFLLDYETHFHLKERLVTLKHRVSTITEPRPTYVLLELEKLVVASNTLQHLQNDQEQEVQHLLNARRPTPKPKRRRPRPPVNTAPPRPAAASPPPAPPLPTAVFEVERAHRERAQLERDRLTADYRTRTELIAQVKDIIPDLGDGFIDTALEVYGMQPEALINDLLEGSLRAGATALHRSAARVSVDTYVKMHCSVLPPPTTQPSHSARDVVPQFASEQDRRDAKARTMASVYNDEYDDSWGDAPDAGADCVPPVSSVERTIDVQDVEELMSSSTDDDEPLQVLYTPFRLSAHVTSQETECTLFQVFTQTPGVFDRSSDVRRSPARKELRDQLHWSDEQIEGWASMLQRDVRPCLCND